MYDKIFNDCFLILAELLLKGPFITGAYYKNPDSKEKFHNGWLTTGDIASIDAEGYRTDIVRNLFSVNHIPTHTHTHTHTHIRTHAQCLHHSI